MDTAKRSNYFRKELLQNGALTSHKITQIKNSVFFKVMCTVCHYEKLKRNVTYGKAITLSSSSCKIGDIKLLKTRKSLIVLLCAIYNFKRVQVSISCESRNMKIIATQKSKELFEAEFPYSVLADPRNEDEKGYSLDIECYCLLQHESCKILPNLTLTKEDSIEIYRHIRPLISIFQVLQLADFLIITEDEILPVHKAILAVRSKYFEEYLKEEETNAKESSMNYILLDTDSNTMNEIISYMYCGCFKANSIEKLIKIFQMSVTLKIQNLQEMCIDDFVRKMCSEGLPKILQLAEGEFAEILNRPKDFLLSLVEQSQRSS